MSTRNLVAVYGTLKQGRGNHGLLSTAQFVGEGRTVSTHRMYSQGIPYVRKAPDGYTVQVEVYSVSTEVLSSLDALEGHPDWYRRELVPVRVQGTEHEAWMYMVDGYDHLQEITSGNY